MFVVLMASGISTSKGLFRRGTRTMFSVYYLVKHQFGYGLRWTDHVHLNVHLSGFCRRLKLLPSWAFRIFRFTLTGSFTALFQVACFVFCFICNICRSQFQTKLLVLHLYDLYQICIDYVLHGVFKELFLNLKVCLNFYIIRHGHFISINLIRFFLFLFGLLGLGCYSLCCEADAWSNVFECYSSLMAIIVYWYVISCDCNIAIHQHQRSLPPYCKPFDLVALTVDCIADLKSAYPLFLSCIKLKEARRALAYIDIFMDLLWKFWVLSPCRRACVWCQAFITNGCVPLLKSTMQDLSVFSVLDEELQISILTSTCPDGIDVILTYDTSIEMLKLYLREILALSHDTDLLLFLDGKRLPLDGYTVFDYGIGKNAFLHLVVKEKECSLSERDPETVNDFFGFKSCSLHFNKTYRGFTFQDTTSVKDLLSFVAEFLPDHPSSFLLSCNGRFLSIPDRTLVHYGVTDGSIVDIGIPLHGGGLSDDSGSDASSTALREDVVDNSDPLSPDEHSICSPPRNSPPSVPFDRNHDSTHDRQRSPTDSQETRHVQCLTSQTNSASMSLLRRVQDAMTKGDHVSFLNAVNDFHSMVTHHVTQYHNAISLMLNLPETDKRTFLKLACGLEKDGNSAFADSDEPMLRGLIIEYLTHRTVASIVDNGIPNRDDLSPSREVNIPASLFGLVDRKIQVSSQGVYTDRIIALGMPQFRQVMKSLISAGRLPQLKLRLQGATAVKTVFVLPDKCSNLSSFLKDYPIHDSFDHIAAQDPFPFASKSAALKFLGRQKGGSLSREEGIPIRDHKRIDFKEVSMILHALEKQLEKQYAKYITSCSLKNKRERSMAASKMTRLITDEEIGKSIAEVVSDLAAKNQQLPSAMRDTQRSDPIDDDRKHSKQELNYEKAAATSNGNCRRYVPPQQRKFKVKKHFEDRNLVLEAQSFEMKGLVDSLNEMALPLDLLFPAGRHLRTQVGLPPEGPVNSSDCPTLKAKLVFLLRPQDKKSLVENKARVRKEHQTPKTHVVAPAIVSFSNAVCLDLKRKLIDFHNRQPHIQDTTGGSKAYLRVPFIVKKLAGVIFPLVSMGASKAVFATAARSLDVSMISFANEFQNVVINLTNRGIADIRGETPPAPATGPTANDFYAYLSQAEISEDHKVHFPDGAFDIFGTNDYAVEAHQVLGDFDFTVDPILSMVETFQSATDEPVRQQEESISPPASITDRGYLPNRFDNSTINRVAVDAHYYRHQDCCEKRGNQLISNISYGHVQSDIDPMVTYPTNEQMIVFSWILGEDTMLRKTAVDWWLGRVWLGGCITENNDVHLQLAGVQYYGIQHSSGYLRSSKGKKSHGSRYIMTFRFMINPNTMQDAYLEALYLDHLLPKHLQKRNITVLGDYQFINVGSDPSSLPDYKPLAKNLWSLWKRAKEFVDNRGQSYKDEISKHPNGEDRPTFRPPAGNKFLVPSLSQLNKFHHRDIPDLPSGASIPRPGFPKPVRSIAVGKTPFDVVYHKTVVDHAVANGKLLNVKDVDDVCCNFQPLWLFDGNPCPPATNMHVYQMPLRVNKQKKELINPLDPSAFQAARMYKNDITTYEDHLDFWSNLREAVVVQYNSVPHPDETSLRVLEEAIVDKFRDGYVNLFYKPLLSMGSGGSNQPTGATASQFDTLRSDAPHVIVSGPQTLQAPTNAALTAAFERQNAIAVFLNRKTVMEEDDSDDDSVPDVHSVEKKPPIQFLSYYCVNRYETSSERMGHTYNSTFSREFSSEKTESFVRQNKFNLSHRKNSFLLFSLVPAFGLNTIVKIIFNDLLKRPYESLIVSEKDKRSINVPITKVQELVLQQYTLQTERIQSNLPPSAHPKFLNRQSVPGLQTQCEDLSLLEAFLSDDKHRKGGFDWKPIDFPESILDREQVLSALVQEPDFLQRLVWSFDAELDFQKSKFAFDSKTAADIIVFTCAAQAGRGTGLHSCTIPEPDIWRGSCALNGEPSKKKQKLAHPPSDRTARSLHPTDHHNLYTVPLLLPGAEHLPYSLQLKATPGTRDRDVSSAFFRNNADILLTSLSPSTQARVCCTVQIPVEDDLLIQKRTLGDIKDDPTSPGCQFLLNLLFMSVCSRLTGNSTLLDLFPLWKTKCRNQIFSEDDISALGPLSLSLPIATELSVKEFSMFIHDYVGGFKKNLGPLVSKQHDRFIPARFKKECLTSLLVLKRLLSYFQPSKLELLGCVTVPGFLSKMHSIEDDQRRLLLIQTLVRAFSRSGNYQMEQTLYKLFHQVVLDVEGYFPGFAGRVTIASVFPGTGGYEGLSSLILDDVLYPKINTNKRSDDVVDARLEVFHGELIDYFKRPERKLHRRVVGLTIDTENMLRWIETARFLDLCDVEHFCCKVYIVCMNSHPSRTISLTPQCCNYYSWPRPNPKDWDDRMAASFQQSWSAFVELMTSETPIPIPQQLVLREKEYVLDDTDIIEDTTPFELLDSSDDSPQAVPGLHEDPVHEVDPEEEENYIDRIGL